MPDGSEGVEAERSGLGGEERARHNGGVLAALSYEGIFF